MQPENWFAKSKDTMPKFYLMHCAPKWNGALELLKCWTKTAKYHSYAGASQGKKSLWRSSILFEKFVLHMCAIRVGVENYVNLWYNIYVTGLPYYFKQPDNKQEVQQHVLRRIVQPGMAGNRRRRRKCLKCWVS